MGVHVDVVGAGGIQTARIQGHGQARATALSASAFLRALIENEVDRAGIWRSVVSQIPDEVKKRDVMTRSGRWSAYGSRVRAGVLGCFSLHLLQRQNGQGLQGRPTQFPPEWVYRPGAIIYREAARAWPG